MKKIDVGRTISIVANIGVLGGIIFLAYELQQNTLAAQLAAAESLSTNISETERFVAGNPEFAELLVRNDAGERISSADAFRVDVFYRGLFRQWQNAYYQYLNSTLEEDLWFALRALIADGIEEQPGLAAHWRENRDIYTPAFNEMIESIRSDSERE